MRSSQLQYRLSHFHKMQRLWRWWKSRPSGHGALKNPISRSSWTTSLERQGFKVCFCLVRIIWLHLLRDMIMWCCFEKKQRLGGLPCCWRATYNYNQLHRSLHSNLPKGYTIGGMSSRNDDVTWYLIVTGSMSTGKKKKKKKKKKKTQKNRNTNPSVHPLLPRCDFLFVSQLQKSWTRWTTTWTVARL